MLNKETRPAHSRFSPSGASTWSKCSSYLVYKEMFPPSDASLEIMNKGSALHEAAVAIFNEENIDRFDLSDATFENLKEYCNFIKNIADSFQGDVFLEMSLDVTSDTGVDIYGTADAVIVTPDFIQMIDLKTGRYPVKAKNNLQLGIYLMGAAEKFGHKGRKFYGTIYQTNDINTKIETSEFTLDWLRNTRATLFAQVDDIKENKFNVSLGEHCAFCPGKVLCPAYLNKIKTIFSSKSFLFAGSDIVGTLKSIKEIEKFGEEFRYFVVKEIDNGLEVPGYKTTSRKTLDWNGDHKLISKILAAATGFDAEFFFNYKLKTPNEVMKLVDVDVSDYVVAKETKRFLKET